ncbi:iron-containing alcohol dehydrogenase family protein, partial [Vibrio parahaemolyticus V-223/04]
LLTKSFHSL